MGGLEKSCLDTRMEYRGTNDTVSAKSPCQGLFFRLSPPIIFLIFTV